MVNRFERFSLALYELSRYWHKIAADEMEKYGMKAPCAVYLTTLYRATDGITAAQLSELSGRDKADVSRSIAAMEASGLVRREGGNKNQYRALLKLTENGRKVAEHINKRASVAVELGGKGLTPEDRTVFYAALDQIIANLQTLSEEGLPN